MQKKITLLLFLILLGIGTTYSLHTQGQNPKLPATIEVATLVQDGVMTPRQRAHSKLYDSYKRRGRLKDLPSTAGASSKGFIILRGTPELNVEPSASRARDMIADLALRADAIMVGLVTDKTSQLTEGGDFIFTDYNSTLRKSLRAKLRSRQTVKSWSRVRVEKCCLMDRYLKLAIEISNAF